MDIILLGIYATFVFFKFKLLPWNIVSQVIVVTIPIIVLAAMILFLNIVAPSTTDVRAINYVIPIVPRVSGRVTEVPIEPNRPIKKGDALFKIDPVPFELNVKAAEAKLAKLKVALTRPRHHSAGWKISSRTPRRKRRGSAHGSISRTSASRNSPSSPMRALGSARISKRPRRTPPISKAKSSPPTPRNRRCNKSFPRVPRRARSTKWRRQRPKSRRARATSPAQNTTSPAPRISRPPMAAWPTSRCGPAGFRALARTGSRGGKGCDDGNGEGRRDERIAFHRDLREEGRPMEDQPAHRDCAAAGDAARTAGGVELADRCVAGKGRRNEHQQYVRASAGEIF